MFDDGTPIYRQIAGRIRDDVLSGALGPDAQVMSTTQYAAHYRINPATAAKAFQQLVDEGVLYKRRGVGMFVRPDAPERLRAHHRERFLDEDLEPVIARAVALGIDVDLVVARVNDVAARLSGAADDRQEEDA
ncbi:GntR family transcriptional regulator [Egicoccus halophilus]|uniref:GntR family transcriptional regulator n=1 Tax=Egicoccus halophilus TaxID=1670830 RepID=A0A8J3AGZ8_9ACTN|nr:GntR family transcriptional regulator [Egicoccus halophilus]GGI08228.1 GntR family transcriptional regulator [Egicoccus halophilus]